MEVEKVGSCVVIRMKRGENRLNPEFVEAFNEALDKAESACSSVPTHVHAMTYASFSFKSFLCKGNNSTLVLRLGSYEDANSVVTIGDGKFYSLGLDLEHMATMAPYELITFTSDLQKLLARLLTFPLVTVAAINGHIYAGGVFIALAQDYMIMRTDRGWFRLPEIQLKRSFSVGFLELAKARLPMEERHQAIALGKRYTAEEAKAAGIINEVSSLEKLEGSAVTAANRLAGEGLDRKTLAAIKHDLYYDVYRILNEPVRLYSQL